MFNLNIFEREDLTPIRKLLMMHAIAGGAPLNEYEIEGNPVVFQTNVQKALSGFTIPFLPMQSGTGDPSPDNVRPISGWSGVTAVRSGLNMFNFDSSKIETVKNSSGNNRSAYRLGFTNCTLTFSATPKTEGIRTPTAINITKFVNERAQTGASAFLKDSGEETVTFEVGAGEEVVLLLAKNDNAEMATDLQLYDIQIELGSTASTFTEYTGESYTFAFQTIIYGGTLDAVNGVLTVDMAYEQITASYLNGLNSNYIGYVSGFVSQVGGSAVWIRNWNYDKAGQRTQGGIKALCNMFPVSMHDTSIFSSQYRTYFGVGSLTSVSDFISSVQTAEDNGGGLFIAYELATPIEIPLDPITVQTLIGDNVIWTDTNGENTIRYKKKG